VIQVDFRHGRLHEIQEGTARWLRKQARHHERKLRGRGGRPCFERLSWLAALRLHKLGFTSPEIRAILNRYACPDDFDCRLLAEQHGVWKFVPKPLGIRRPDACCGLKTYQHDSKVCQDIRRAADELRAFETALAVDQLIASD
jgi:hypothetical protein